jgi:N-acetylneuraminic acid mutarotase
MSLVIRKDFGQRALVKFYGRGCGSVSLMSYFVRKCAIAGLILLPMGAAVCGQVFDARGAAAHNSWHIGVPLPTARQGAFIGAIGGRVFVTGGATDSAIVDVNEIYAAATNTWETGASMPTPRWVGASAVVNNVLYTIGGQTSSSIVNVVEAYDPVTNTWSTKAPIPIANDSASAVVNQGIIYVIGGFSIAHDRLRSVQSYNPATNQWEELPGLKVGKSLPAVGAFGRAIVAAGGLANSGAAIADNEGYSIAGHSWSILASAPSARQGGCFAAIGSTLYFAGGSEDESASAVGVLEAYTLPANSWTTGLASMPNGVANPASATLDGRLYCFGGSDNANLFAGSVFNYVQVYQP